MQVAMKSPSLDQSVDPRKVLISPVIRNNSRGARFLDLVKSNKLNVSPQLNKKVSLQLSKKDLLVEKKKEENNEYLKFSSNLPDLNSSPSNSILSKRKAVVEETPDSPMNNSAKRKRVSFNDPVSTTKEYLITDEEEKLKSNSLIRCLMYEESNGEDFEENSNKENQIEESKPEIKIELNQEKISIKEESPETQEIEPVISVAVVDHDYENPQNTDVTTSSLEDIPEQIGDENPSANTFTFKSKQELMEYVSRNIPVDELLEKFTQAQEEKTKRNEIIKKIIKTIDLNELMSEILILPEMKNSKLPVETIEATSTIINHISKLMKGNDRIKHKVLDMLSEKHSKDFLSHALQENSTATVCEKLTLPNLVNFIIHKANVCDDPELECEINRMNRNIMHHLIKKTADTREVISDPKETQELLHLLFKNKPKIDVLDNVHEFLRNVIQGPY